MIQLAPGWRLDSDTTWLIIDPSNRPVVSTVSRAELYQRLHKLGLPLTEQARDALADLPEFHAAYRKAR